MTQTAIVGGNVSDFTLWVDLVLGGYYVVYEGGYKSFSPADAFESGYTLIN